MRIVRAVKNRKRRSLFIVFTSTNLLPSYNTDARDSWQGAAIAAAGD
jgi:hypothetical protein